MTGDGEITFQYRVSGTFAEKMELEDFPFDAQDLSFNLSTAIPCECLVLKEAPATENRQTSAVQYNNFAESNVYWLAGHIMFEQAISDLSESTSGVRRPKLMMSMKVQRKPGFHVYNVIVPMVLISGCALCSFAVPKEDVADRLSVSLTILLTVVAFKLQIASTIPALSYLTLLDQFCLANILLVILIVGLNAIGGQLSLTADHICLTTLSSLWFLANLAFSCVCFIRAGKNRIAVKFHSEKQ